MKYKIDMVGSSPKELEKRVQGFEGSRIQVFVFSIEKRYQLHFDC